MNLRRHYQNPAVKLNSVYQQMSSFFLAYSLRSRLNSDLNWLSNLHSSGHPSFYLEKFRKLATSSAQRLMWDPYLSPTPIQGRCFFETLSAVGFKPLLPISLFILYHIFFLLSSVFFWIRLSFPLCDNHHLSLTFFNNIITYFSSFCQLLFFS